MEHGKPRKRTARMRVDRDRFQEALDRVEQYIDRGQADVAEGVIGQKLGWTTVKSWLANREKALFAYQAPALLDVIDQLPPLGDKKHSAYSFIVDELGSQTVGALVGQLRKFEGSYSFRHRFNVPYAKSIKTLNLLIQSGIASYVFSYRREDKGARRLSDGFVFARNQRLFLIGLSKSSIFYATFVATVDPRAELMYGVAAFEEIYNREGVLFSRVALVPPSVELTEDVEKEIADYLSKSIDKV